MVDLWMFWSALRGHILPGSILLALSLQWVGRAPLPRGVAGVYKALWRGTVARSLCGCKEQQGTVFLWRWIEGVHRCMYCKSSSMWEQMFLSTEISTQNKGKRSAATMTPSLLKSSGISFFPRSWAFFFPWRAHSITSSAKVQKGWDEEGGVGRLLCRWVEWCCHRSSVGTDSPKTPPTPCRKHKFISFELKRITFHS